MTLNVSSCLEYQNWWPYLRKTQREAALHTEAPLAKESMVLHVPFYPQDSRLILEMHERGSSDQEIASLLKKRKSFDIKNYLSDVRKNLVGEQLLFFKAPKIFEPRIIYSHLIDPVRLDETRSKILPFSVLNLKPRGSFNYSSGAVTCIKSFEEKVLVAACALEGAFVNKPGELVSFDLCKKECKVLDAHFTIKEDRKHRETVADVQIFKNARQYISAGYDAKVKFWNVDTDELVKEVGLDSMAIQATAVNRDQNLFAAGTSRGVLSIINERYETTLFGFQDPFASDLISANAIDAISFGKGVSDTKLFSLTGYSSMHKSGVLECYDLETRINLFTFNTASTSLSCLSISNHGSLALIGCGQIIDNLPTNSCAHLIDTRTGKSAHKFQTNISDMDLVDFDPFDYLAFIADTQKNVVNVYDIRFLNKEPKYELLHEYDESIQVDSTMGWFWSDNKLFTGGSDKCVKVWDFHSSDLLVKKFSDHNSSVTAITIPENNPDVMVCGTESGMVYTYSCGMYSDLIDGVKRIDLVNPTPPSIEVADAPQVDYLLTRSNYKSMFEGMNELELPPRASETVDKKNLVLTPPSGSKETRDEPKTFAIKPSLDLKLPKIPMPTSIKGTQVNRSSPTQQLTPKPMNPLSSSIPVVSNESLQQQVKVPIVLKVDKTLDLSKESLIHTKVIPKITEPAKKATSVTKSKPAIAPKAVNDQSLKTKAATGNGPPSKVAKVSTLLPNPNQDLKITPLKITVAKETPITNVTLPLSVTSVNHANASIAQTATTTQSSLAQAVKSTAKPLLKDDSSSRVSTPVSPTVISIPQTAIPAQVQSSPTQAVTATVKHIIPTPTTVTATALPSNSQISNSISTPSQHISNTLPSSSSPNSLTQNAAKPTLPDTPSRNVIEIDDVPKRPTRVFELVYETEWVDRPSSQQSRTPTTSPSSRTSTASNTPNALQSSQTTPSPNRKVINID